MKHFAFLLLLLKHTCSTVLLLVTLLGTALQVAATKNGTFKIKHVDMPMNVLVMLPTKASRYDTFGLVMNIARPVIDKGLERAISKQLILPNELNFTYVDSRLWEDLTLTERHTTVAMIEAYHEDRLDLILGLADSYSIATVSKICAGLKKGIPVITTSGFAAALSSRKSYTYLTRMRGSYDQMAESVYHFLGYKSKKKEKSGTNGSRKGNSTESPVLEGTNSTEPEEGPHLMEYQNLTFVYHDPKRSGKEISETRQAEDEMSSHCYFSMYAIKSFFLSREQIYKEAWSSFAPSIAFHEDKDGANFTALTKILKQASKFSNMIILCASPDTVRNIMLAANKLGMVGGTYVFINIDISTGSLSEQPWNRSGATETDNNMKAREAYKALKTISLRRHNLKEYKEFVGQVRYLADEKYNYSAVANQTYDMNNFISAFYEAVYLYALALNETIEDGKDPRNGSDITSRMWNRTFPGIAGEVSIDSNGDRYSDYSLLDFDPKEEKFVEVAYYSGRQKRLVKVDEIHWVNGVPPKDSPVCAWDGSLCPKPNYLLIILCIVVACVFVIVGATAVYFQRRYVLEQELAAMSWKIKWEELNGEDTRKEKKKKRSKLMSGLWYETEALIRSNSRASSVSEKKSTSSGATRKISALIDRKLGQIWRKKSPQDEENPDHKDEELNQLSIQKYPSSERVHFDGNDLEKYENRIKPSVSVSSAPADAVQKKNSSNEEEVIAKKSLSLKNRKLSFSGLSWKSGGSVETIQQANTQMYTTTALYKGIVVALKKLKIDSKKYPKLELSRDQLLEFKKMKDLQSDHITRFTGACVDCPHYVLVQEYCPRGSLEDILENEKLELDKMMKYSLLHDLVKGMHFLHNSFVGSHGKLKSSNCVVDGHFVLKVTDFGFHKLHALEEEDIDDVGEHAIYKSKLWTAPEILRNPNQYQLCGTKSGDVYSFALILHEMLLRKGVFFLSEEPTPSPKQIIERVKCLPGPDEELYRPEVPEYLLNGDVDDNLISLMIGCWAEEPLERPDFSMIRKVVRSLNKPNETANLVDNLLLRMEQYANNLEGLVEERTQDYLNEKQKVENLLHQLLPPSVADQLIIGQSVQAEAFDSVTIYFSDIVGFTALSSASTPMQVVTFLNDLYLAFDLVVDNYKVYKVETIGDAYMVVSGLPERNSEHASQIAQMALALLHRVKTFVIRHRPNEQLKLRIGIHSGSVVAGVVGSKMPRYCLFGDTVNTSSRMESTGLPLKIHVSQHTKSLLDKDPGFRLELRGQVEMKGKGTQTTYWLTGYKELNIPDFGSN